MSRPISSKNVSLVAEGDNKLGDIIVPTSEAALILAETAANTTAEVIDGISGAILAYLVTSNVPAEIKVSAHGGFAHGYVQGGYEGNIDLALSSITAAGLGSESSGYAYVQNGDSATAKINTSGQGARACGVVFASGGETTSALIEATGDGSCASGYARCESNVPSGTPIGRIRATNSASEASGYVQAINVSTEVGEIISSGIASRARGAAYNEASITASGTCSVAEGLALSTNSSIQSTSSASCARGYCTGGGTILASQSGSCASGYANTSGTMEATGFGAHVQGYSLGVGNVLRASGRGAHAGGVLRDSTNMVIEATNNGSFAHGFANAGFDIQAIEEGAFALGSADTASIVASASNSAQFGPGTNDLADSFQIGTGMRFKGTDGAPASPANGDVWLDAGTVYIRSNGVSVAI